MFQTLEKVLNRDCHYLPVCVVYWGPCQGPLRVPKVSDLLNSLLGKLFLEFEAGSLVIFHDFDISDLDVGDA